MYARIVSDSDRFVLRRACCDSTFTARSRVPPGVPEQGVGPKSRPRVEGRAANVLPADRRTGRGEPGIARKFGWVRKLPSGRDQASYISPDGARVNTPTTFTNEEHAEKCLAAQRTDIERETSAPPRLLRRSRAR